MREDGKWHPNITLEIYANYVVCPEPCIPYLKVLEEGGHKECVHTSYVGAGITAYRPHVGDAITSAKVVYKNLRYTEADPPLHVFALRI